MAAGCIFAQNLGAATLPFKSYTTSEGLAHDRVNRIFRDSRGLLWFCTSEGLSRFDGYQFKNYTQDDGLPHRAVMDMLETRDGRLWLATGDGVVLFDPVGTAKNTAEQNPDGPPMFRTFRPGNLKTDQTTWDVEDLLEDRNGTIWLATGSGLFRLYFGEKDWQLDRTDTESWGHSSVDLSALLEDRTGALWVGAERGLYRLLPDGGVQKLDASLRVGRGTLMEDRQGTVWVGTNGGESTGLYRFGLTDAYDEPKLLQVFDTRDGLTGDHWINAMLQTQDGRIFVGVGNGLCEFEPNAPQGSKHFRKISDHAILSLGEDSGGNLWLGTGSAGAFRMARRGFVSFDESDGLRSRTTASIVDGGDGETYVLGGGDIINRFDGDRFSLVSPLGMQPGTWSVNQITFRDHLGQWWVTGEMGLQCYPPVTRLEDLERTKPAKLYTTLDGLFRNAVFQLFEDSRGDIWISVIGATNSVNRWDRSTGTIRGFTVDDGFPVENCPTAFGEDPGGNIWMGFYSGGLGRFRNGVLELFTTEEGMPPGNVRDIHTDTGGRVWVATSSRGVVRIDAPTAEKPQLVNLTTVQGLSSNQASCVTEDKFGRIYIGTGRGVSRLDLVTGGVKVYTKADGLRENYVTLCQADAGGGLWFATNQGLARYIPIAEEATAAPPVFIGSVRANGDPIRKLSELGETSVTDLSLASDKRQLQIEFFALGFSTAETLRYQYRLDGINGDWSEPTTQRTVNLTLSPGDYRFLVRAITSDRVLSESPASVSFSIARPLWQRWWFLLSLAIVLSGLFYLIYRYRLKRLVELEKVRTRIATDLHDDIGSSLSQIAILSEVVRQKIGDSVVNEPLNMIADTSREMVDSMSDIVWAINPDKDHLSDLVQRMRRFASDILDASDIAYRFDLDEAHRETVLGADVRREVYLIFKECINNLVKHAFASEVEMSMHIANKFLVVTIKDNGKGFDLTKESGITNGSTSANGHEGFGGNGLVNMRRRTESLGGSFIIESEVGSGTSIRIRVPVKEKIVRRMAT